MEGIFQRSIVAAIFALAIGWASAVRLRKEFEGSGKDGRRLYSSFSYYAALPLFLLIYAVAVLIALRDTAQNMLLSMFFYVFLTLSVYYIVLAPLHPPAEAAHQRPGPAPRSGCCQICCISP